MTDTNTNTSTAGIESPSWIRQNELIHAATAAKRPTRWWLALIVGTVIAVGFFSAVLAFDLDEGSFEVQMVEGAAGLAMVLAVLLWVRFKEQRPMHTIGFLGSRAILRLLGGLVVGIVLFGIGVGSMWGLGGLEQVDVTTGTTGSAALGAVAILGLSWLAQAGSEEVIFRGFMFQPAALQLPVAVAFLAPTFIFAFLHSAGEGAGPLPLINVAIFSIAAMLVALADKGLWLIIGIHTGWNWAQGNMFGIPVSGRDINENTLIVLSEVEGESRLISGGGFGLEATIATTVIWVIVAVVAAVVIKRQRATSPRSPVHVDRV